MEAILVKLGHTRTYIKRHLWKYHYVFSLAINNLEKTGWVSHFKRVNIKLLTEQLGGESKIKGEWERYSKQVLDDLVKGDVIIRQYIDERLVENDPKSTRRRINIKINDNYIEHGYEPWVAPEGYNGYTVYAAAEKLQATYFNRELRGIYKRIAENNAAIIEFDVEAARRYADHALATKMPLPAKRVENVVYDNRYVTPAIHCHYHKVIDRFENREFGFSADDAADKTNRLFWLVANSPRGVREFITLDGEEPVEADIASSQLLVFAIYLKQYYRERHEPLPDDVVKYIALCEAGQFYQYAQQLVIAANEKTMTKELFKVTFFGRIFFSTEKKNYAWRTRFAADFENVSRIISEFKEVNYKNLPQKLSYLESEIMLHKITPRLFAEGITKQFSIHDAFFCKKSDLSRVEQIITEEFQKYGVTPFIKPQPSEVEPVVATEDEFDLDSLEELDMFEVDAILNPKPVRQLVPNNYAAVPTYSVKPDFAHLSDEEKLDLLCQLVEAQVPASEAELDEFFAE